MGTMKYDSLRGVLQCPVCGAPVKEAAAFSLTCAGGHTFNLSRYGYANLLTKKYTGHYEDASLFAARRRLYEAGLFAPVLREIGGFIGPRCGKDALIFEAGCGEGSLLRYLRSVLPPERGVRLAGMDISKSAVLQAARAEPDCCWMVGDLCRIPLRGHTVHFLIDMLTPSNYAEFNRVLRRTGYLLKVVPRTGHLRELRELFGLPAQEKGQAKADFGEAFAPVKTVPLTYSFFCGTDGLRADMIAMTPLGFSRTVPPEAAARLETVTVDVELLIGRKKRAAHEAPASDF